MAIKQITPTMECQHRIHDFIIDTDADAADLPATCASGSTALSCASGNVFIVNASGAWVQLGGAAAAATTELDGYDPYAMPAGAFDDPAAVATTELDGNDPYAVAAADLGGDL